MADMDAFERRLADALRRYADEVSVAVDAVEVAHKLIRITNERHSSIASTPVLVSRECDCLLMSAATGWKWLDSK